MGSTSTPTFEELLGGQASHQAPVDGKVVDVKKGSVVIEDHDGHRHEMQLYNNYPLNDAKGVLHSTPLVKPGDSVKKGQTIADTNYSKNGVLALGTNLRTAYIPFKGYNFEDGIVISESAAQKLSSEHLQKNSLQIDDDIVLNKRKFHLEHPGMYKKEQYDKLDDNGVVRVGQKVVPGDPLIAAMKPGVEHDVIVCDDIRVIADEANPRFHEGELPAQYRQETSCVNLGVIVISQGRAVVGADDGDVVARDRHGEHYLGV